MTGENPDRLQSDRDPAMGRLETTLHKLAPLTQTNSPLPVQPMSKMDDIETIMGVLSNMAGASSQDINQLIDHLYTLREHLKVQGERIHDEIGDYLRLNRVAMESTQVIAEHLAEWNISIGRRVG